jgi:hypothetical protein
MDLFNLLDGIFREFVHTSDMDSRRARRTASPHARLTAADADSVLNSTHAKARFWSDYRPLFPLNFLRLGEGAQPHFGKRIFG